MSAEMSLHLRLLEWAKTWLQWNPRDPLDCGTAPPEAELARFGSLRLTPRRIIQTYRWRHHTAPLARVVRVDVQRIHTRTWLLMAILCLMCGWSLRLWLELELFRPVGLAGAGFCAFVYLLSRRTKMRVSLEDGTELQVAVRNKHFAEASRFANILCRVCTHWEPRERSSIELQRPTSTKAELKIEEDEEETFPELEPRTALDIDISAAKEELSSEPQQAPALQNQERELADEPTVEIQRPSPGWMKLQEPG